MREWSFRLSITVSTRRGEHVKALFAREGEYEVSACGTFLIGAVFDVWLVAIRTRLFTLLLTSSFFITLTRFFVSFSHFLKFIVVNSIFATIAKALKKEQRVLKVFAWICLKFIVVNSIFATIPKALKKE
jgi:hypothetical protein